jgi:hypothetical protein
MTVDEFYSYEAFTYVSVCSEMRMREGKWWRCTTSKESGECRKKKKTDLPLPFSFAAIRWSEGGGTITWRQEHDSLHCPSHCH